MNNDNLNELLKEHFSNQELPKNRVQDILAECDIARSAFRWRRRAIGATSLAAASVIALGIFLSLPPSTITQPPVIVEVPAPAPEENHKMVAIMIHSTDCPKSQAMDPVFAELQEQFIDESILFIKFDYSSDCAKHQAELLSKNLGLKIVFDEYKRTGDIVLVSSCGKVQDVVDRGETFASATSAIRKNLEKYSL